MERPHGTAPTHPTQLEHVNRLVIPHRALLGQPAHGDYQVEVQLQDDGEVVWRDGPPEPWQMTDPLRNYDLKLTLSVIFPEPGDYEFVLLANGEEVAREKFHAHLIQQTVRS